MSSLQNMYIKFFAQNLFHLKFYANEILIRGSFPQSNHFSSD